VRFLKQKSDVLNAFQEFKAEVENLHERKIKALQSDNGGEYCSAQFEQFLKDNGIVHRKTVPYSPSQNGVAERVNRTIANIVKCLLIQSGAPKVLWAEAANTACVIRNLCSTRAIQNNIPQSVRRVDGERM